MKALTNLSRLSLILFTLCNRKNCRRGTLALSMGPTRHRHAIQTETAHSAISANISRASFLACIVASTPIICQAIEDIPQTPQPSVDGKSQSIDELISGFVSGAALTVTKTAVKYPLDTATVRLQMKNSPYRIERLLELFKDSYNGITSPLLANIPGGAVFFAVKDASKQILKEYAGNNLPQPIITSISVGIAQFPYWLIRNPSEVVKTRQQAGMYPTNVTTFDAYQQVFQQKSFYKGYLENIAYTYPADVLKFVTYDALTQGRKDLSALEGATAGALATATAQLLTTPLDVVRNRIMMAPSDKDDGASVNETITYWGALERLAREEGTQGLFAGAVPRVGKALLSGAIQFATYEETKQLVMKEFEKRR